MISVSAKKKTEKSLVGLDINASTIAATEVRTNGTVEVVGHGVAPLPAGTFHEGEVVDAPALGAALKDLFASHKLSSAVRLGVANQRIAVRTLRLPAIADPKELATAIRFQAAEHMPMPIDRVVLDWSVVGHVKDDTGATQILVVVIAARREMLGAMLEAMDIAGLRPVGIDLSAFGMIRALARPGGVDAIVAQNGNGDSAESSPPAAPKPATLFCNLDDITNLAVAQGSICHFTRVLPFGLEGIVQKLSERSHLTLEHARMWLRHVGLSEPVESIDGDPEIVATTREILTAGAAKLVDELRLSLSYYGSQGDALDVDSIVLCGQGTTIPGLAEALQGSAPQPFEIGRAAPLASLDEQTGARLTVSYGLALDE
jgi:type IV pilus assembly protein PilM